MSEIPGVLWIRNNSKEIVDAIKTGVPINTALALDKYIPWEIPKLDKTAHLERVSGKQMANLTDKQYGELKERVRTCPGIRTFTMTTETNLIVNLGGETVLETSLALHPYYGFPIIPGSAVKGLARHYCEEHLHITEKSILNVFGGEPGTKDPLKGNVIFFDAWPERRQTVFHIDIMTPHYSKYYGGNGFPTDSEDPNPIPFLTVKKGTVFEFALALTPRSRIANRDKFLGEVETIVKSALGTFGIGAKTGSSYGYFRS